MSDRPMRMSAYYYSFTPTAVEIVNRILSAVACAGKSYHNTVDWTDEAPPYEDFMRGECPVDWIQNAAQDAADTIATLEARVAELEAGLREAADRIERKAFEMPPPNPYTPEFVTIAVGLRALLATAGERAGVEPVAYLTVRGSETRVVLAKFVNESEKRGEQNGWGHIPLFLTPPPSIAGRLMKRLDTIAKGDTTVFDEDLQTMVQVSMDADEMAAIARAALAEAKAAGVTAEEEN